MVQMLTSWHRTCDLCEPCTGVVDAASDIMEWMLRVQIERDDNDPKMKAIADEFRFQDDAYDIDLNSMLATSGG